MLKLQTPAAKPCTLSHQSILLLPKAGCLNEDENAQHIIAFYIPVDLHTVLLKHIVLGNINLLGLWQALKS